MPRALRREQPSVDVGRGAHDGVMSRSSPQRPFEPSEESGFETIGPESTGRWLITTQGSQHVLDVDEQTYQRLPGRGRSGFAHDQRTVPFSRVEQRPAVGSAFVLWFDDPDSPDEIVYWRRSSTIRAIERADARDAGGA